MKKFFYLLPMLFAAVVCAGCKKEAKKEVEPAVAELAGPQTHRLEKYFYEDSLKVGSVVYTYTIHREADDALGVVIDENEDKWVNTYYQLTVLRNGSPFFEKRIEKETLGALLSEDFKKYGIIDGFRLAKTEDAKLFFSLCVSYPNSDMSSPFLLIIGPDGSYTMEPDLISDVMNMSGVDEF